MNNNNNDQNNKEIEEITHRLGNLTLNTIPTTNLIVGNISYDQSYTAISMYYHKRYYSILRNTPKCVLVPIYTKLTFNAITERNTYLLLYPYFCSFTNTAPMQFPRVLTDGANVVPDTTTNAIRFMDNAMYPAICGKSAITGSYRLVCATIKIMNLTSQMNKSGQYILYRLDGAEGAPCVFNSQHVPTKENAGGYFEICSNVAGANYSQLPSKNNFSALQIGFAHEFNLLPGTQVFSAQTEYVSGQFYPSNTTTASYNQVSTNGLNIKYLIQFEQPTQVQNYTVEMWQVFEVIPQPGGGLENLSTQQTNFIPPEEISKIRSSPNICPY